MSLQKFAPEVQTEDYDEAADPSYNEGADPDYDECGQGEFADDFADPDSEEAGSQEWYKRSQK
jgi:hypothetical protein